MSKVVIDMSVSLDGFVAGPEDGPEHPMGTHGGDHVFDWFFSGSRQYKQTMFRPKGANRDVVASMFRRSGAMLTGRRTYEIADGWSGEHPVNAIPVVVLTHIPPVNPPKGKSKLVFVTAGIEAAVNKAKALAKGNDVGIGGASVAQQALKAGLVDEIHLHIAPILLGGGVSLFDRLGGTEIPLKFVSSLQTEEALHLRLKVLRRAGKARSDAGRSLK